MHEALGGWENFYVIVGSSAAALTGLQFVVIALLSEAGAIVGGEEEIKAFGTPTVVHFCSVLLIAAICSTPHQSAGSLAACFVVSGMVAIIYLMRVVARARHTTGYKPVRADWVWHTILPMIAYTTVLAAGIFEMRSPAGALYPVAGASLLLLYVGIHNAWDTATYISITRRSQRERERDAGDGAA